MADTIDRRIVEMRFDNKDFEKNVGDTLISLETLKKALEMSDASKGLEEINKSASKIDLSGVQNGVEQTSRQFSALEVIAITALANITNSAMNAGKRLVSSFVKPMISGGKQRAMNMAQAKFMFAGLGYAEKEIGSASEENTIMGRIYKGVEGTFYSLDRAALIASQLMASGMSGTSKELTRTLKNVAGISSMFGADYERVGQIFAKIKATDRAMAGDLTDLSVYGVPAAQKIADYLNEINNTAQYTQESVNDLASKGKIDFETFSNAFDSYGRQAAKSKQLFTGAMEDMIAAMARVGEKGWTPLLKLARDFLNATVPLIDNISGILTPAFEKYGNAIDNISDKIARITDIVAALFNYKDTFDALKSLAESDVIDESRVKALENAFDSGPLLSFANTMLYVRQVLSKNKDLGIDTSKLEAIQLFLKRFGDSLAYHTDFARAPEVMQNLADAINGVASVAGLAKEGIVSLFDAVKPITRIIPTILVGISSLLGYMGRFLSTTVEIVDESGLIRGAISLVRQLVDDLVVFTNTSLATGIHNVFHELVVGLSSLSGFRTTIITAISDAFSKLSKALGIEFPTLSKIIDSIKSIFSELYNSVNGLSGLFQAAITGFISILSIDVLKYITRFFRHLKESGSITAGLGEMFNEARLALITLQNQLTVMTKTLQAGALTMIATAILELALAMRILSKLEKEPLLASVAVMGILFKELIVASYSMKPMATKGLMTFAIVIRILVGALDKLGQLDFGNLAKGIGAVSVLMQVLIKVMERISIFSAGMAGAKLKTASINSAILALIGLAFAVKLLVKPVTELSKLDLMSLAKGLGSVAILFGMMVGSVLLFGKYLNTFDMSKGGIWSTLGSQGTLIMFAGLILAFAAGVNLVVSAVKTLGALDMASLKKGLGAVGIILAEFITFITFYDALQRDIIKVGKTSIKPASLIELGVSMLLIAAALNAMAKPVKDLAKFNVKELAKGLGSIAIMLIEVIAFLGVLKAVNMSAKSMLGISAAFVVLALGINVLAGALADISAIPNAGTGLATLFGSLLILGGAMTLMKKALPGAAALIVAAGALMMIAPAISILSNLNLKGVVAGLIALAGALAIMGAAGYVVHLLPGIATGLMLLSASVALFGVGVFALASGITLLAAAFATGIDPIVAGIAKLSEAIPVVCKAIANGIVAILEGLVESAPLLKEILVQLIDIIVTALVDSLPKLYDAGILAIVYLLNGLKKDIGRVTDIAIDIVLRFVGAIRDRLGDITDAAFELVVTFVNSLANTVATKGTDLVAAIENLLWACIEVLASTIPFFGDEAAEAIEKYRQGLADKKGVKGVEKAANDVKETVEDNIKPDTKTIYNYGVNATTGLKQGLASVIPSLRTTATTIANIVDETVRKQNEIRSPSRRLMKTGRYLMLGLIKGVDSLSDKYQNRADSIATTMVDSVNSSFHAISTMTPQLGFSGSDFSGLSASVNYSLDNRMNEQIMLNNTINKLANKLDGMTESMNSRSLNVYNTIDGTADPEGFADSLIRSFRLNARTV